MMVRKHGAVTVLDLRLVLGIGLAVLVSLCWSAVAHAQPADDQYAAPASPSGPATSAQCTVSGDTDGVVNAGDQVICEGEYDVADGASVTLQDADGTQGTFVDGINAVITEGSIVIRVTDAPIINVPGANGVLDTEGLFVVATTGIAAAGGSAATGGVVAGDAVAGGAQAGAADAVASGGGAAVADDGSADAASGGGAAVADGSAADEDGSRPAGATPVGVLPDTGGMASLGILGALMLLGVGLLLARGRLSSGER